ASTSNSANSLTSTSKKMKISDISTGIEQSKRLIFRSQNELEQPKQLISKQSALPISPARPPFNIEPFIITPLSPPEVVIFPRSVAELTSEQDE
ncbi:125_t:CDS:2, partial [Racocetra fulgida]